jgi:hypothetical protein
MKKVIRILGVEIRLNRNKKERIMYLTISKWDTETMNHTFYKSVIITY